MEIDYLKLGRRLRAFRVKSGLTQAQLAEASCIEPSNISHIERGATKVSLPTLVKLANALGASLDSLVYDSLEQTRHISYGEISELLSDCSNRELKAIARMIRATKDILRTDGYGPPAP